MKRGSLGCVITHDFRMTSETSISVAGKMWSSETRSSNAWLTENFKQDVGPI